MNTISNWIHYINGYYWLKFYKYSLYTQARRYEYILYGKVVSNYYAKHESSDYCQAKFYKYSQARSYK